MKNQLDAKNFRNFTIEPGFIPRSDIRKNNSPFEKHWRVVENGTILVITKTKKEAICKMRLIVKNKIGSGWVK